jgi:uncharacterized protein DUF4154
MRALLGILALATATWSIGPQDAAAQDVSIPVLKAAFLENFVKFAEWPDDAVPSGRVFTFCVAGDKTVASALERAIKQHSGAAPTSVVFVTVNGPLRSCQLLYLGSLDLRQSGRVIDALKGLPVFTVSDVDGFAELGGVAQLRLESGRIRFVINPAAAQRARLALSAKLLSLATLVKDGSNGSR